MQPAPAIRGNPYRGGGPRRGRLTSEQDVLEDIIATSNGDFNQNAIMQLQETKRITAEQEKAERIANAINSAVVFLPTGIKAKAIMFTIVIGTSGLLFVRRPWANGWTLNSVVDTLMYTSLVGISFYILMKMSNAVSEAKRFAPTSNPILTP